LFYETTLLFWHRAEASSSSSSSNDPFSFFAWNQDKEETQQPGIVLLPFPAGVSEI